MTVQALDDAIKRSGIARTAAAGRKAAERAEAAVGAKVRHAPPEGHAIVRPKMLDAAALLRTKPEPVRYVIPGWLPDGLTLLVANPKVGKSTLILQAAVALASGGEFWGEDVPQGKALMIDLETNERRLRRKLEEAGVSTLEPGALLYATEWPKGHPGIEAIGQALNDDPAIKLVVIDTLQRFRDSGGGNRNAYAADYDALAPLQQLCRVRPGLAIVVVHHKRKAATDDPIDSINGSAAIAGAADGIWILSRKAGEFALHVQARDWERDEDEFRLERRDGRWELSDAPRYSHSEREVLSLLDKAGPLTTKALADALQVSRQAALKRLQRMRDAGHVQFRDEAWHAVG